MSKFVDTSGGPESVSLEDRWYLQQRGQLPGDWPELSVADIAELVPARHEREVFEQVAEREYNGVVGVGPDAGPERDGARTVSEAYTPEMVAELERLRAELARRDAAGEPGAAAFGTQVLDDAPELSQAEQDKADRIADERAAAPGASADHDEAGDNVRADPDRIAITAAERGPAALAAGTTELPLTPAESAVAQQEAQRKLASRKAGRTKRGSGASGSEPSGD
jgi:hypothetical protein